MLIAAVAGVALTARLGIWQLDRASQKIAMQRSLDERSALPELPEAQWPATGADVALYVNRRVRLTGEWLPRYTVFLDNRPMDGREGFYVVTPFRLNASGRVVAVQRGWSPRAFDDRTRLQPVATPGGVVEITGRIAPAPGRLYDFGGAASGAIRQNLDLADYATETGESMARFSVVQDDRVGSDPRTASVAGTDAVAGVGSGVGSRAFDPASASPRGDGLLRHWPRPALDVQRNYGYAFQWFALCALMVILYAWFQIVRPRLKRDA